MHSRLTGEPLWEALQFSMVDVISVWPAEGSFQTVQDSDSGARQPRKDLPKRLRVPDADLRAWYEQRVRDCVERQIVPTGNDDWAAAREQFSFRVTRDRVRALRTELAPAPWKLQGRRPWEQSAR